MTLQSSSIADSHTGAQAGWSVTLRYWRRWLPLAVIAAIGAIAVIMSGCGAGRIEWAAWGIVSAPNRGRVISPADDPSAAELAALGVSQAPRVSGADPAVSLSVWIMDPPVDATPRGTILVFHGIKDRKESQLGMARLLAGHGFRAVLVDARGHGRSTGDFLSYGVRECEDYRCLLDELERRGLLAGKVGVFGMSYGAGCAVQLAGRDARIAAVVAVAPFSSLRREVHAFAHAYLPWTTWCGEDWIDAAVRRASEVGGFDPDAADGAAALRAAAKMRNSTAQVLIIHGGKDAKIPWEQGAQLCAAAPERTRMILLMDEDHDSITLDRAGVVGHEAAAWFEEWLQ